MSEYRYLPGEKMVEMMVEAFLDWLDRIARRVRR